MSPTHPHSNLLQSLISLRPYFVAAGTFSFFINILMIVPAIYMLQVYDRALSSQSLSTLGMLTLIMIFLLAAMGGLEWVRGKIMVRAASRLGTLLSERVFSCTFRQSLISGSPGSTQALIDLNGLRTFLGGPGIHAFFDAPWVPVYVFVMFAFHSLFGWMAVGSIVLLSAITWANQRATSGKVTEAGKEQNCSNEFANRHLRNAEVIESMGMMCEIRQRWSYHNCRALGLQSIAAELSGLFTAFSKTLRIVLQSLALGLGAYLAINMEISPGMMIAGSILLGRALAPVDLLVGAWKGLQQARQQYSRLDQLLGDTSELAQRMSLPSPCGHLRLSQVQLMPPGGQNTVLEDVSFELEPGSALGVIGPSASGKTCLARAILGIWPVNAGTVRLDGADISNWERSSLGPYIGYLPQDIALFDGSIAQNIARFRDVEAHKVVEAAELAGVHEMVLRLPEGYDTMIGAAGGVLAGGQRQRIGLARAIYGKPKLVVLDEPNSNLDESGESALCSALLKLKTGGTTVIVITHRPSILSTVDQILVMNRGGIADFGPAEVITGKYQQTPARLRSAGGPQV